jgi:uncharacterized membrane protein YdbT with pleckstrin-like domain
MGYPTKLLSEGEEIVTEFRPHWSAVLRELLLVVLGIALIIILALNDWLPTWLLIALVVVLVVLTARGFVTWLTTQHVITNERVIHRTGLISKQGKEIPLEVINDVAFTQSIFERMFGTGDLLFESAGTHGQSRYRDIPKPEQVQQTIYEVRERRMMKIEGHHAPQSQAPGESSASQLATLSRLHDEGKLTDEEFETQKKKLLGGS